VVAKSVKIRMFFAIFRRKLIAQCRSSVRYGLAGTFITGIYVHLLVTVSAA